MDPQTTASILELLESINKRFGITIVIITHQMSVVREICTHVAIMKDGQVAEKGLVTEIFEHPKSEVARELINKDTGSDVDGTRKVTKEINNKKNLRNDTGLSRRQSENRRDETISYRKRIRNRGGG